MKTQNQITKQNKKIKIIKSNILLTDNRIFDLSHAMIKLKRDLIEQETILQNLKAQRKWEKTTEKK